MKRAIAAGLVSLGVLCIHTFVDAQPNVVKALSLLWIIAYLWVTETFHITVTALLIPVLAVAFGLLDLPAAMVNFAHPIIFLFLGGFALATAMHIQGVDRWLAQTVLHMTGGRLDRGVLLLAVVTALLSMWISNTAVTAMMLPLVLGLLSQKEDLPFKTQTFSLLIIAYSASIGGIGTLVGSPPNAIVAAELGLTFLDWMYVGLPMVILLWPVMLAVVFLALRPDFSDSQITFDKESFEWTPQRKILLAIFALTVAGWLLGKPLSSWVGISNTDSWVALIALLLLTMTGVVGWKNIEQSTDWGVLLLFGGGLTLSAVLGSTGAGQFLGHGLAQLIEGWHLVLVMLALVVFVQFFGELTSNTAATALMVPIFMTLPPEVVSPTQVVLAVGVCASCAFMLPVSTPPNALVHGTGKVPQRSMIRVGVALNLTCSALLTLVFSQFYRAL